MPKTFRQFLILLVTVPALAQTPATDYFEPLQTHALGGSLGQQLQNALQNRVQAQNPEEFIAPFRTRNECRMWQSEFWGKWFTSAALGYRYAPDPAFRQVLDGAVQGLLATQTPDGYIGNYADSCRLQSWDVWGRKYCLLGLLAHYDLTGDKKVLHSASRLADHLMAEISRSGKTISQLGNFRGMAAGSVLEPIVLLYRRTNQKKYLDFANAIVQSWETPDGPQLISAALADKPVATRFPVTKNNWWSWKNGQKAYEMMSCYEGLLELYRVTGEPRYRQAVERVWDVIRQQEINIAGSGSSMECWYFGNRNQNVPTMHTMETCVTVTWLKLNAQLLRLTGESRYADEIEKTLTNALLASQKKDGSWASKYTPLAGTRGEGELQCGLNTNCCVASGPRALMLVPQLVYQQHGDELAVHLFTESRIETKLNKTTVQLGQTTRYPYENRVELTVSPEKSTAFKLALRIPAWSKTTRLWVNGLEVEPPRAGGYATISRTWKAGDRVRLELDFQPRLVYQQTGVSRLLAIERGPLVLARDRRLGGPALDETLSPVLQKDGSPGLRVVAPESGSPLRYVVEVPFLVGTQREGAEANRPQWIRFTDFASAGNTWDDQSRYRVWLPALVDVMNGELAQQP